MRRHSRWGLALVAIVGLSSLADAATKLCVVPTNVLTLEGPPDPQFVIVRRGVEPPPVNAGWARRPGKRFADRVTPFHEYWARRTVYARPGDSFVMDPALCSATRYRVTPSWRRRAGAPRPVAAERHDNVAIIRWAPSPQRSWVRVDWAFRSEDLDNGLHGSHLEDEIPSRSDSTSALVLAAGVRIVHVRLTRYHLDGTESSWRGWLHAGANALRIGTGPAPVSTPALEPRDLAAACEAARARPVPIDPTFRSPALPTPRRVAMTCDGRLLPVSHALEDGFPKTGRVTVRAMPGERFWLRDLPLAPGAPTEPLLVATHDAYLQEAPVVVEAAPFACSVKLALADEHAWDRIEVASMPVPVLASAPRLDRFTPTSTIAGYVHAPTLEASPLLVRVTPIWSGRRGTPRYGVVHTRRCDRAWFVPWDVPAANTSTHVRASEAGPKPVRREASDRGWLAAFASVLGLLGLLVVGYRRTPASPREPSLG